VSIRYEAIQVIEEVEEAMSHNPNSIPNSRLVNRIERLLGEGKAHFLSDFHRELDWRQWPIPQQWTLANIRELASAIHETARKYDNAMGPALATRRLGKI
jgi:hypothetical protein